MVYGGLVVKASNLTQLRLTSYSARFSRAPAVASRVNSIGMILIVFGLSDANPGKSNRDTLTTAGIT